MFELEFSIGSGFFGSGRVFSGSGQVRVRVGSGSNLENFGFFRVFFGFSGFFMSTNLRQKYDI